jgi:pimeloyl-ACP methyl ester carboxylesterase
MARGGRREGQIDSGMLTRPRLLLIALALPLIVVGTLLASVWAPDRSVAELASRWAPPPSEFRQIGVHTLHLRDEGPREDSLPIVLLHGTSASLHTWDAWTAALSTDRRVVRFDLPGFGLTGPAPDDDYRISTYVDVVVAVLDSLGIARAVIAGNSLGGQIAAAVGRAAPERVAALVLVDPAGFPFTSESVPIGFRLARSPATASLMTRILPRSVVRSSLENVYGDPTLVTEELVDRYYELTLREGNRAALPVRFAQEGVGVDTLHLREIVAPTLILWGDEDRLIPVDHAARFARDIAGSRLVRYPGLGHVPHEEAPARTLADVQEFLARLSGAAMPESGSAPPAAALTTPHPSR